MGKSGNPAKRAQQETERAELADDTDQYEPPTDESLEDFDEFWRARRAAEDPEAVRRRTTTIMGETVTLPASVPIIFDLEAKRLRKSKSLTDMQHLAAILFGEGVMQRWARKGMTMDQFAVLIAWAPMRIAGENITLAQVAAELEALEDRAGEA